MWIKLGDLFLGPLIDSWRAVREIQRDVIKDDGPVCEATEGFLWRRRRCSLALHHDGEHRFQ
jgi:hypothetical protein